MKKTILFTILTILTLSICLTGCKTKQVVERVYIHTHDSVTVHDTVPQIIHVTDHKLDSAKMNLLQNQNDSLLNALDSKQAQLDYLAEKLRHGKLNTDTMKVYADLAWAWAVIVNNDMKLGIEQVPFDTLVNIVNSHTTVTDVTSDTTSEKTIEEVEVAPPFYRNYWFYIAVVIALIWLMPLLIKLRKKLLI